MAVGVTSLGRDQKLPPYQMETVLAGSKRDPLQDTAEQIRQAGGTSVITFLSIWKPYLGAKKPVQLKETNENTLEK